MERETSNPSPPTETPQPRSKKLTHTQILESVLIDRAWRYIQEWLRDSSSDERLGLRMINAIVENKGERRFKKKPANFQAQRKESKGSALPSPRRTSSRDWEAAAAQFRKGLFRTSYGRQFGGDDLKSLRETQLYLMQGKKFTQTHISQIIVPTVADYIEKWLEIEKDDDYKNLVLGMVRSFYTRFRNHEFTKSSNRDDYSPPKKELMAKAPRFDKLRTAIEFEKKKEALKAKINNLKEVGVYETSTRSAYRSIRSTTSSSRKTNRSVSGSASAIIGKPSELKARFLKGNGKITDSLANIPGKSFPSLYQESFKGHMIKQKVMRRTDQDFFSRSFSGPHVSPDPPTIYYDREKISRYTQNLSVMLKKSTSRGYSNGYEDLPSVVGKRKTSKEFEMPYFQGSLPQIKIKE